MRATDTDKHWKKGYVSGSFDLFHIGHLNLIRRAKARCDYLIVGVLTDELIFGRKKKWPVVPLEQRMEIVAAIKYVDEVVVTTPDIIPRHEACIKLGFDAFFTGDDWQDTGAKDAERRLGELGADLVFFPYTVEQSTTQLQALTLPPPAESADKPEKLDAFTYLFPFDKVVKGERIVIYGAGVVGTQYLSQLKATGFCEVTAVADANAGSVPAAYRRIAPGALSEFKDYDRIVIASKKYYGEIASRLRVLGISAERIV